MNSSLLFLSFFPNLDCVSCLHFCVHGPESYPWTHRSSFNPVLVYPVKGLRWLQSYFLHVVKSEKPWNGSKSRPRFYRLYRTQNSDGFLGPYLTRGWWYLGHLTIVLLFITYDLSVYVVERWGKVLYSTPLHKVKSPNIRSNAPLFWSPANTVTSFT